MSQSPGELGPTRFVSDDALKAAPSKVNLSRNTSVISTISSSSSLDVPPVNQRHHVSDTILHTPENRGRPPAWLSRRFNRETSDSNNNGTQTPRGVGSPAPAFHSKIQMQSPDDFEFGEEIGGGSWSIVVDATHISTGKHYAIKILNKAQLVKEKMAQSAVAEKNALAILSAGDHPGIIKLYSAFQDSTSLSPNGDLRELVKSVGSFSVRCARYYAALIVDTVQWMHTKGVLHRDLKPENILLNADMRIKLADFGSAYVAKDLDLSPRASTFVGTAAYVSPELLSGSQKMTSISSDIWAIGCVIYFLFVGQSPFLALTDYLSFKKIEKLDYTFMEGFDPEARDLIMRLIVTDPTSRLGISPKSSPEELRCHPFFIGHKSEMSEDSLSKYINWQALWTDPPAAIETGLVQPPLPLPGNEKLAGGMAWDDFINAFSVISTNEEDFAENLQTPRAEVPERDLYPLAPSPDNTGFTHSVPAVASPPLQTPGNNNMIDGNLDDGEKSKTLIPSDTNKNLTSPTVKESKLVNDPAWSSILFPHETILRIAKVEVKFGRRPFHRTDHRFLALTTSPRVLCIKKKTSISNFGSLVLKQEFLFPESPVSHTGKQVLKVSIDARASLVLQTVKVDNVTSASEWFSKTAKWHESHNEKQDRYENAKRIMLPGGVLPCQTKEKYVMVHKLSSTVSSFYSQPGPSRPPFREKGMEKVQEMVNETAGGILGLPDKLHPPEEWWARQQRFLADQCGLMLRPRYHPNWVPSWYGTAKNPRHCEDSVPMPVMQAFYWMDAIRMADNKPMMMKRVRVPPPVLKKKKTDLNEIAADIVERVENSMRARDPSYPEGVTRTNAFGETENALRAEADDPDPEEVYILNKFSNEHLQLQPNNHCGVLIDIRDILEKNPDGSTDIIMIMPLLRPFNDPPFLTVGEGLDFIRQALDAVQFLHSYNIAHRDCSAGSFMYDPTDIFPEGYHPVLKNMSRDLKKRAKYRSRTEYPPRYYIINFTHAKMYEPGQRIADKPVIATDTSIPEFQGSNFRRRHDPFATDVYILGNMIKHEFIEGKHGFEFLTGFVETMIRSEPKLRPSMDDCVREFAKLCRYIPKSAAKKRFIYKHETEGERIINNVSHMIRNVKYSMKGTQPVATQYIGQEAEQGIYSVRYDQGPETSMTAYMKQESERAKQKGSSTSLPSYPLNLYAYNFLPGASRPPPLDRSHSVTYPRKGASDSEFAKQQSRRNMQVQYAFHGEYNRYHPGSSLDLPPPLDGLPNLGGMDPGSSKHRILLNNSPGQNRKRTASDSAQFYGPRVSSPKPLYPIPIRAPFPFRDGEESQFPYTPRSNDSTSEYVQVPLHKRRTPTHTPVPAQRYTIVSQGEGNGPTRAYNPAHTRTNTNGTDNTKNRPVSSVSSVAQTQETIYEIVNGNGEATTNGINNADVSQLDLEQTDTGSRSPTKPQHERPPIEREQTLTPKPDQRKIESKSKSKSKSKSHSKPNAIDPGTGGSESHSHSHTLSKFPLMTPRDTFHTMDTQEFKMRFPEPEIPTPPQDEELSASPVMSNVPASLLTGPALAEREGSIHSIPDNDAFETSGFIDNNHGAKVQDGRRKSESDDEPRQKEDANEDDSEHKHKHHEDKPHERTQTNGSASKKDRSTKWDCALCLQKGSSKSAAITHMQNAHPEYHLCFKCGSYYTSAEHLERHQVRRGHDNNTSVSKQKNDESYSFPAESSPPHRF